MGELEKSDIYACALQMPTPEAPQCDAWVAEIEHALQMSTTDEVYLVGHSLGVPAILRYLEAHDAPQVRGAVLVAGPAKKTSEPKIDSFLMTPYEYTKIMGQGRKFAIIQGDDDPFVSREDAEAIAAGLSTTVIWVPGGKHLNGSAGFNQLPQALVALQKMMI